MFSDCWCLIWSQTEGLGKALVLALDGGGVGKEMPHFTLCVSLCKA